MSDRDPLQTLWTQQEEEPFAMSVVDIHIRSARFQARIRRRNWREHIVAALLVAVFGWVAWMTPDLIVKTGSILIVAGLVYISVRLAIHARAGNARDLACAKTWIAFYRGELLRQHEALRDILSWYLAPLVPGITVFMAGAAFTRDNPAPLFAKAIIFVVAMAICAAVFGFVYWINRRAARQLKAAIDKLDTV